MCSDLARFIVANERGVKLLVVVGEVCGRGFRRGGAVAGGVLAEIGNRRTTPGDGPPATESTTAYLSYDDKNFYAAFVCHDEAGEVRAHLSKREASDRKSVV